MPDLFRSLYHEGFYSRELFLSTIGKIAGSVIEKYHKAKGEEQEQPQPKKAPHKCHFRKGNGCLGAINTRTRAYVSCKL
jgi:hypothetical protein